MSTQTIRFALCLGLLALVSAACGSSGDSSGTSSGGAGDAIILFQGVGQVSPISPTEVTVTWAAASSSDGLPRIFTYRVYRAFTLQEAMAGGDLRIQTAPGVTSYVDTALPPYTTVYYRVVAVDSDGDVSLSSKVRSAFTPATYMPGTVDYATDVAQLWNTTPGGANPQTCLDCHSAGGPAIMKLDTYEGAVMGVGDMMNPDSFVTIYPFDGANTWLEFLARFNAQLLDHINYLSNPQSIGALQAPISAWADEGALETPDSEPPLFRFADVGNAGLYRAFFPDFNQVTVEWFTADDPESLPLDGNTTGQLEYVIFAGPDPESINWHRPVGRQIYSPVTDFTFDWPGNSVAIVVRALDASGRHNPWPAEPSEPPGADPFVDAQFAENSRARRRNETVNSRVLEISRESP